MRVWWSGGTQLGNCFTSHWGLEYLLYAAYSGMFLPSHGGTTWPLACSLPARVPAWPVYATAASHGVVHDWLIALDKPVASEEAAQGLGYVVVLVLWNLGAVRPHALALVRPAIGIHLEAAVRAGPVESEPGLPLSVLPR